MAITRLDHVIFHVPDIERAHRELTEKFPEAWPVGPFWRPTLTSGIALGGINLELVQSSREEVFGQTLAFAPTSLEAASEALERVGIRSYEDEKMESDPELLRLRGFPGAAAQVSQLICRNLLPLDPGPLQPYPVEFFFCDYSPFLKEWLSPEHPRLQTESRVTRILYGTPNPVLATDLLLQLDYPGKIPIEFTEHHEAQILRIETNLGPVQIPG
jgi:hypothetical protein